MELNSSNNPLLKAGTVLHRGGGLTKKGVSLEKGTSNALGIQTYKKHKVWKIEDFDTEKKVAKPEGAEKDDDENSSVTSIDFFALADELLKNPLTKEETKLTAQLPKNVVEGSSINRIFSPTKTPLFQSQSPFKSFNKFSSRLNNAVDYRTPSGDSIGSLSTGYSPTVQMLSRTPMYMNTRVTRQSTNARVLFPETLSSTPSKRDSLSLSLDDLATLQRS
jgi:hypothetical protein